MPCRGQKSAIGAKLDLGWNETRRRPIAQLLIIAGAVKGDGPIGVRPDVTFEAVMMLAGRPRAIAPENVAAARVQLVELLAFLDRAVERGG